ncbi:BCS1 N terminal-domain-containing protein [Hypoxylon trugodes]|uniref:BCS1 N terminal-domain-containing protein n=1 Tax=Hypoxylon trugodes TaxID=326681 RepID=UPI00218CA1C3|nr:BCS1 N terminal-domain-containing protein [Hypoxylon trugodes]KAI1387440.1 BCS1 N terminal-domain-containing protein [Hypoxylon trugodes]
MAADPSGSPAGVANGTPDSSQSSEMPRISQFAVVDIFFPGFSTYAGFIQKYLRIDLNLYIPLLLLAGALTVVWSYTSSYLQDKLETHFMSTVDIRTDDEIYNIIMAWVTRQRFSKGARKFVASTNINSRCYYLWDGGYDYDDDDDEEYRESDASAKKNKTLSYTPAFGSHYFWYRGRLLVFKRSTGRNQMSSATLSQREEISLSCFGRDPWILKELLMEARELYIKKDSHKTLIYRGTLRPGSMSPFWQRCMARATRPFSTVILNEDTKQELIDDVTDYLCPATQRWYANRGIPYRRGYLLHGPPGTGKSSLSLALAGYFQMRIYIVSLSSMTASEESLASLFAELPRRCVVLLEDIDSAGLTHTREENQPLPQPQKDDSDDESDEEKVPGQITNGENTPSTGRSNGLSLSGLLNILDGVASQEGRILIMTTNHVEKLDKALIRPGRVDMTVHFSLADEGMCSAIFRAIFASLDGDDEPEPTDTPLDAETRQRLNEEKAKKRAAKDVHVSALAEEFASKIPTHEFSPAELQGYLMKHKRNAQRAVENVNSFIEQTRKDHKEKEFKEAERKRKEEAKKKEEEEKKQQEEAKEAEKKSKAQMKGSKKSKSSSTSDESTAEENKTEKEVPTTESSADKLDVKVTDGPGRRKDDSGYVTPASGEP